MVAHLNYTDTFEKYYDDGKSSKIRRAVTSVYRWFAQSTIRANSQDDSRRMIRATGDDSRNSMDVLRKQAAMLFLTN